MMRNQWAPYVSVAKRRRNAQREIARLRKKGLDIQPIEIDGRKIARTFWAQAWCEHLESFSDYANRLPRGRTYVRNGSVCHLKITKGRIEAIVSGSDLYNIDVNVKPLPPKKWTHVKRLCAGRIGSLLELLQGKLSSSVMGVVTDRRDGLFPAPREISFDCDCPDWAKMCKHVAAVLYGIGARLDERPELLFLLRGVDHEELIATEAAVDSVTGRSAGRKRIAESDLADVFGIDLADGPPIPPTSAKTPPKKAPNKREKNAKRKTVRKKPAGKTAAKKAKKTAARKTAKSPAKRKVAKKEVKKTSPARTKKKTAGSRKTTG